MAESKSGGIGLAGILFIVFLTMKLTGYVTWSWWWVTAPLWISLGLALVLIGFAAVIALIVHKLDGR